MTMVNQDFTMYAGETKSIIVNVSDVVDLFGATVKWTWAQSLHSTTPVLTKEQAQVKIDQNKITIKIDSADTQNLIGQKFTHRCDVTDQYGDISVVSVGTVTIL